MAPKQIQEWSLSTSKRKDGESVWRLRKDGRRPITMRFQEGMSVEDMEAAAKLSVAVAENDPDVQRILQDKKLADSVTRLNAERDAQDKKG